MFEIVVVDQTDRWTINGPNSLWLVIKNCCFFLTNQNAVLHANIAHEFYFDSEISRKSNLTRSTINNNSKQKPGQALISLINIYTKDREMWDLCTVYYTLLTVAVYYRRSVLPTLKLKHNAQSQ